MRSKASDNSLLGAADGHLDGLGLLHHGLGRALLHLGQSSGLTGDGELAGHLDEVL